MQSMLRLWSMTLITIIQLLSVSFNGNQYYIEGMKKVYQVQILHFIMSYWHQILRQNLKNVLLLFYYYCHLFIQKGTIKFQSFLSFISDMFFLSGRSCLWYSTSAFSEYHWRHGYVHRSIERALHHQHSVFLLIFLDHSY